MKCRHCKADCIKKGKQKEVQVFRCKDCLKYQRLEYAYNSKSVSSDQIAHLIKEGCGIRSIGRILKISNSTVIRRTLEIAKKLKKKSLISFGQTYQVDELFTFVRNKTNKVCVAYSYNPKTQQVIDIVVGRRNKTNLNRVTSTLILAKAKTIITDKLAIYKELIPTELHSTKYRGINHIERQNLTLRTHLKRLNRRTICFSKSLLMLEAVLKIYFWY